MGLALSMCEITAPRRVVFSRSPRRIAGDAPSDWVCARVFRILEVDDSCVDMGLLLSKKQSRNESSIANSHFAMVGRFRSAILVWDSLAADGLVEVCYFLA